MPVQLDVIIRGFAAAAQRDPTLRERQPYKAAHDGDLSWLGRAMVKHYQGDDAEREVDDRGGADKVLGVGFTEISMRDDWATVFAG
jgi:hypothetical protein